MRLKYAYIIKCDEVVKDEPGNVIELRCTVDLDSKSGGPTAGRKVKGTIHWVSASHAIDAEVRLYDRLFTVPEPDSGGDFKSFINPNSLEVVNCKMRTCCCGARVPKSAINSSGSAISRWIRIPDPKSKSGIARLR